jgi:hypothetical protein
MSTIGVDIAVEVLIDLAMCVTRFCVRVRDEFRWTLRHELGYM